VLWTEILDTFSFWVLVALYAMWNGWFASGGIIVWQYPLFRTGLSSSVFWRWRRRW
jgi:hypothetical protein